MGKRTRYQPGTFCGRAQALAATGTRTRAYRGPHCLPASDTERSFEMSRVVVLNHVTLDGGSPPARHRLAGSLTTTTGVVIATYQTAGPAGTSGG